MEKLNREIFSSLTRTKDYPMKLIEKRLKTDKRKYLFTKHVVNVWNSHYSTQSTLFTKIMVMPSTVNLIPFKKGTNKFIRVQIYEGLPFFEDSNI